MYKIHLRIENVRGVAISDDISMYNTDKEVYSLMKNQLIYHSVDELQEIKYHNKFYINDIYGKGVYFDEDLDVVEANCYIHLFENEYMLCSIREGEERHSLIKKLNSDIEYRIQHASTINYLKEDKLFRRNFDINSIEVYLFPTGQPIWRYNLNDLGKYYSWIDNKDIYHEVEQFLGIYEQILWVHLKGDRLLGLEVETGIIKYDIKNVPRGYGGNFLNQSRGVIQILALESYWEFDLRQQKFTIEVLIHPEKKYLIRSCTFYENDTNIYFCGRYENAMAINCFGIFDSVTHQVVWYEVSRDKAFFPNPPQASEHKLYILDSENRLAIYEKSI